MFQRSDSFSSNMADSGHQLISGGLKCERQIPGTELSSSALKHKHTVSVLSCYMPDQLSAESQSCSIYFKVIGLDVHPLPELHTPNRGRCADTCAATGRGNSSLETGAHRKEGFARERESV